MAKVVLSSGHGSHVPGASGIIDEVTEARRVVDRVVELLGEDAIGFHDDVSYDQDTNLATICAYHNSCERELDVSVHFNAYVPTDGGRGCEVLYISQDALAEEMSWAISKAGGLINRGAHKRTDLYFLSHTEQPAILLEICFVDAQQDVAAYQERFEAICVAIARVIDDYLSAESDENEPPARPYYEMEAWIGTVSWFGGPNDTGVAPDEGLAFLYNVEDAPELFLDEQPPDTTGLARRLDPDTHYIACRWDYSMHPKDMLASGDYVALVRARSTGEEAFARPADWGPHEDTGRIADLSPGLMAELGIETDDEVLVIWPVRRTRPIG